MVTPLACLLALVLSRTQASSEKPPSPTVAPIAVASPEPLRLVTKGGVLGTVEIHATRIPTREIVERLKADLKLPITASNIVANHEVDLALKDVTVISLLGRLAPVALADIEIGAAAGDITWKAIHLLGYNEKEPEKAIRQVGLLVASGFVADDGSISVTEPKADDAAARAIDEEPADPEAPTLAVIVTGGRVSMRSRKQHLAGVLNEIAVRAKVPFDIRGELDPVPLDLKIKGLPLRDLPAAIGRRGVRIVVRRNLATGEEVVQGILAGETSRPVILPRE